MNAPALETLLSRLRDGAADPETDALRNEIAAGGDPLGEMFLALRSPPARRQTGAIFTPPAIVKAMTELAERTVSTPARIVDPGAGTGRFLLAAGRRFPRAELHAWETDPLAARILAANARVAGIETGRRLHLHRSDFLAASLEPVKGPTLFLGNPPWLRHHAIPQAVKKDTAALGDELGVAFNRLSGLHVHFMFKLASLCRPGDGGVVLLPGEWLHTGYGEGLRSLLAGPLGLLSLDIADPGLKVFRDATASASIVAFRVGARCPAPRFGRVLSLDSPLNLGAGRPVEHRHYAVNRKWTALDRRPVRPPGPVVPLSTLFRVHRGASTGNNGIWIEHAQTPALPRRFLVPALSRARELFDAPDHCLADAADLRRLVLLPETTALEDLAERAAMERFLAYARARGGAGSWTARNRRPWWRLRLRPPAPILCSVMARRPPVFVLNDAGVVHLTAAHGLYPVAPMARTMLRRILDHLNTGVSLDDGRLYAGGLVKFEPGDIARLRVPASLVD